MSENGQARQRELIPIDQVAVIRTGTGVARLFAQTVNLSVAAKTLISVPGLKQKVRLEGGGEDWRQVYLVSADGYKAIAAAASLFTINAPTVCVDGKEQPNPYIIRDEKLHIRAVYCRSLTFGYTPLGVPTVSDRTAIFDIHQYRLTDLLAKAKRMPNEFKILAAESAGPEGWIRYPVDEFVNLWANPSAAEFCNWLAQMVNRERKAIEIAQTFAQRNAIKNHPNVKATTCLTNTLDVKVLSWIPTEGSIRWDLSQWQGSIKQLIAMTKGGTDAPPVTVVTGQDEIHKDPAEVSAEAAADADEVGAPVEGDDTQDDMPTDGVKSRSDTLQDQIKALYDALDPKTFNFVKACEDCGIKVDEGEAWELASEAKLVKLLGTMEKAQSGGTKKKGGKA